MSALAWLLVADGIAFVAIGIVVLVAPSPQATLTFEVDARTLAPFEDTRRLLASQFIGNGLLALLVGFRVDDVATLRFAALARVATLLVVLGVNVSQLRGSSWKPASLYGLVSVFTVLGVAYVALAVRG